MAVDSTRMGEWRWLLTLSRIRGEYLTSPEGCYCWGNHTTLVEAGAIRGPVYDMIKTLHAGNTPK